MNELIELVKVEDDEEFEGAFNYDVGKYNESLDRLKDK